VLEGREVRGHRRQRHVFVTAPRNWSICGAIFWSINWDEPSIFRLLVKFKKTSEDAP
jgi:hypothetical protein